MKTAVAIALAFFSMAVSVILVLGFMRPDRGNQNLPSSSPRVQAINQNSAANVPAQQIPSGSKAGTLQNTTGIKTYASSEVARHNSSNDCWLIIENKVYDVSRYLKFNLHPGEAVAIPPYCGKDASNAFATKDRSRPQPHSGGAWSMLSEYYVGDAAP